MHAAETCLGKIAEVNGKIANKMSVRQFGPTEYSNTEADWNIIETSLQKEKGAKEAKEKIKEQCSFFDEFKEYIHNNQKECLVVAVGIGTTAAAGGMATITYVSALLPALLIKADALITTAGFWFSVEAIQKRQRLTYDLRPPPSGNRPARLIHADQCNRPCGGTDAVFIAAAPLAPAIATVVIEGATVIFSSAVVIAIGEELGKHLDGITGNMTGPHFCNGYRDDEK